MRVFESVDEFIADFQPGHEVVFVAGGIGYGAAWNDNGPYAYRGEPFGFYEQTFDSVDAMLDGFIIEGQPLRVLITQLTDVIIY